MKVAHSCYRVADLERSLVFYNTLGFAEVMRLPLPAESGSAVFLQLDGDVEPRIELWWERERGPSSTDDDGYHHVGVVVDDLDSTLAALAEQDIQPMMEPFRPMPDEPTRLTFITDPDGYRVELLENYRY